MAKRAVDLIESLSICFDEEAEDSVLEPLKHFDTKYFRIMKLCIFFSAFMTGISMYEYLKMKIEMFTNNYSILSSIIGFTHILFSSFILVHSLNWKYRFRLSVIKAYNRILLILCIIAITNFMTIKIIPWIHYIVIMITYGFGYRIIVWLLSKELPLQVSVSLSIVVGAALMGLYCYIVFSACKVFNACYESDRLSEQIYTRK